MAFFWSKEYREKLAEEKSLKRLQESEQKQREEKQKREYCTWYSCQTQNFIDALKEKGFNPDWGFEAEPATDYSLGIGGKQKGNIFVFDIPSLEGLAFDMKSKQMLYFTCPTGYYDSYRQPYTKVDFQYILIPFSEIFKANLEINSELVISTTTSKQNNVGKIIMEGIAEGLFGDEADNIIDWEIHEEPLIIKSQTVPKHLTLNIQTIHPNYPIISFDFNKSYYYPDPAIFLSNKSMVDTMYSIFYNSDKHVSFKENHMRRTCKTIVDYEYYRTSFEPKHDRNNREETDFIFDYITKFSHIEIILNRLKKYVMKIDAIIQQCNRESQNNKNNTDDIISQLTKLSDMKDRGIITEKEFIKLKKNLL